MWKDGIFFLVEEYIIKYLSENNILTALYLKYNRCYEIKSVYCNTRGYITAALKEITVNAKLMPYLPTLSWPKHYRQFEHNSTGK